MRARKVPCFTVTGGALQAGIALPIRIGGVARSLPLNHAVVEAGRVLKAPVEACHHPIAVVLFRSPAPALPPYPFTVEVARHNGEVLAVLTRPALARLIRICPAMRMLAA